MKVEKGQIWQDNSSRIEVEILEAPISADSLNALFGDGASERSNPDNLVRMVEVGNPRSDGILSYVDLYMYFTYLRRKE